jgi:hypothetical protein
MKSKYTNPYSNKKVFILKIIYKKSSYYWLFKSVSNPSGAIIKNIYSSVFCAVNGTKLLDMLRTNIEVILLSEASSFPFLRQAQDKLGSG